MVTRKDVLNFLVTVITVLEEVRGILAIVPDHKTLLHHLSMFRDFLYKEYESK